jgi:LPXTG-motif cell wall-anchored protein
VLGTSDSRSSSSQQSVAPTTPASVLGSEVARTQTLPRTGVDPSSLLLLGLGLAMSGTALLTSANRFSRSRS